MPDLAHYSSDTLPPFLKYQLLAAVRIEWFQAFTEPGRRWDYISKSTQPEYFTLFEQDILISFAEVNQRLLHHANDTYKLYGDPDEPRVNEDAVMVQFVSSKGRQHQSTFMRQPVYVGQYRW